MGCAATALGTTDGCAGILDRSVDRAIRHEEGSTGDPSLGAPGTGPVLPAAAEESRQPPSLEGAIAGQEIVLHEIWFQLSLPDRQRFGHRFSGMVLKALGHRSCSAQEVEA
jgi:hypothetical protein